MKKGMLCGLLLAGILTAAVMQAAQDTGSGILYRVSGGKNEMYLLGSIHVGSREMYPMSNAIQTALRNADALVFECDTESAEAAAVTAMLMKSEKALSEQLSPECYELLKKAAEKLSYSMENFERMKPWAVTSTLTVAAAAQEMNVKSSRTASSYGVENMVRRYAKDKQVLYLETAEEQLKMMDQFSPALQEHLLTSACNAVLEPQNAAQKEQDVEHWPEWWKEGNTRAFADSYLHELEMETDPVLAQEYHHALMSVRNLQMAHKLQQMLEKDAGSSSVVTVGLMHLVLPEDSIILHLQAMGYQVEQIR